jgi:branched-chain amino acid aminotransferase
MPVRVSIDGVVHLPEEAKVSVFDRSFLFGDSVYETLRTYGGRLFAVRDHMDRLERSAERLRLRIPVPRETIVRWSEDVLRAAGNPETTLRIVVSRGVGEEYGLDRSLDNPGTVVLIARPLQAPPDRVYEVGLAAVVAKVRRNPPQALDPAVKSGNYLNSILAAIEARDAGADDAIFLDLRGDLAEATTSAVFLVTRGVLRTSPLETGILDSITRRLVLRAASRLGIPTDVSPVPERELREASEVFLASTVREVLPVTTLDHRPVGDGRPGPVTRRLAEALRDEVRRVLDEESR